MFWGLNMKPNRKYSLTPDKSFHISQAALQTNTSHGGANKIWITFQNQRGLICTLRKEVCEQVMLDLTFTPGKLICFENCGSGNVTLSGYVIDAQDMGDEFMYGDEEKEDSDTDESEAEAFEKNKKAKRSRGRGRGRGGVTKSCKTVGVKVGGKRRKRCLAHMA